MKTKNKNDVCSSEELVASTEECETLKKDKSKKSVSSIISSILAIVLPIIFGTGFVATNFVSTAIIIAVTLLGVLLLVAVIGIIITALLITFISYLASASILFYLIYIALEIAFIIGIIIALLLLIFTIVFTFIAAIVVPIITDISSILGILTIASGALGIILSSAALADRNKLGIAGIICSTVSILGVIVVGAITTFVSIIGTAFMIFMGLLALLII